MALSIVAVLAERGGIDQDRLAQRFAQTRDSSRGYGPGMEQLFERVRAGEAWQVAARNLFAGQGSFGNGAAMRVAPLGAYFADDLGMVVEQATLSAEVTHVHHEGVAGAIAVAVAAALARRTRRSARRPEATAFLDAILPHVPRSDVQAGLARARELGDPSAVEVAVAVLGNGSRVSAQDTVPFALWCAANHLGDYEQALWLTVSGLGDRDTTCAIAGGVVAASTGVEGIPSEWRAAREPLPEIGGTAVQRA